MFCLEKRHADEMISHARSEEPNECCGILAGVDGRVTKLYRTTNAESSPVRYNIDPKELLMIYKEIEDKGWDLLGIYHSHTHTEAYPSATDVMLALWPESLCFIISLEDPGQAVIRAFQIIEGRISEQELKIVETP